MSQNRFESEFSPQDLPNLAGNPMTNSELSSRVTQQDRWILAQRAQQRAVIDAVSGFYIAKRFAAATADFDGWTNKVAESTVEELTNRLWKIAVIDIAKMNDSVNPERSASLPGILHSMKVVLESSVDSTAHADLIELYNIRSSINPDSQPILKYVRHIRNKWAGHPSLDIEHDSWADADKGVSIPLLEEALALLVRAHQDVADLVSSSPTLKPLFTAPPPEPIYTESPNGITTTIPMRVAWDNIALTANLWREIATRQASALIDQMHSPPGYGSVDDTDWSSHSAHSRHRAAIDLMVAKMRNLDTGS